jgi:hypothetical protein
MISHLRLNRERMLAAETAGKSTKPARDILSAKFDPHKVYSTEELF